MENASKALIMAGSILMSLLVIGIVVFMYGKISDIEQTKTNVDESEKASNYAEKFEQYNKTIYGSELLSLANLQEDYKKNDVELEGYSEIKVEVTIKRAISGTTYFAICTKQDISQIINDKNNLEAEIEKYEKKKAANNAGRLYKGRVIKDYASLSYREIASIYDLANLYPSTKPDYEIGEDLPNQNNELEHLMEDISDYKIKKNAYMNFKNKKFKCTDIKYDDMNGRVKYMLFTEV